MTFPSSALGITVELDIGGTWTDVSSDVRGDGANAVAIQRGITSSGGSVADRGTCDLVLDNRSGDYSSRNPRSPYFGLIGRSTKIRVGASYGGAPWLDVPHGDTVAATTPDSTSLSVTGDIDVRFDAELAVWGDGVDTSSNSDMLGTVILGGKAALLSYEWWLLVTSTGCLQLAWTTDGSTTLTATSGPLYAAPGQRLSVRATLDVNNGASGHTVTFYTSSTAGTSGPWTQLGSPVVVSGTTSIFNGTAALAAGDAGAFSYGLRARKIYGMQVRSGIGGTIVASPDFTAQTAGATSFTDSAGAVWTVPTGALTNTYRRFTGRVSSWPPQWTTGGFDVTTPITATGRLQQLGQGQRPLPSTLRRFLAVQQNITGYWPCEDGQSATQAAAGLVGVQPMTMSGWSFGQSTSLAGSDALPVSGTSAFWSAPVTGATAGVFRVEMMINIPSALTANQTILTVHTKGGTYTSWSIIMQTDGNVGMTASGGSGATEGFLINVVGGNNADMIGNWQRVTFMARTSANGTDIDFGIGFANDTDDTFWYTEPLNKFLSESIGTIQYVSGSYGSAIEGTAIGHVAVYSTWDDTSLLDLRPEAAGRAGETAGARVARVCDESSVPMSVAGPAGGTVLMGPQPAGTLLAVAQDAAVADEGLLAEALEFDGIRLRTRGSLYRQPSALDLPYTASPQPLVAPLTPTDDDQRIINDSTVTRTNGSSGRDVRESGPLNVADPPDGVGLYDENITLNLYQDAQTQQHAGWRVHLGTWDEARFPQVNLILENAPDLIPAVSRIDTGSRIRITGTLPDWLPPDPIDLLVLGYTETFAQYAWHITYACVPYGPYRVGVLGDTTTGRLDTGGCELAADVTATDTSWSVTTTSGQRWADSAAHAGEFPFDWMVGGERVTVTAITGTGTTQTATVTRGVNGLALAHSSGDAVSLYQPLILAL